MPRDPEIPPYLVSPPNVVPIDVGRQLFVDDFLIETSTLKRNFHRAAYYEHNPVLRPDRPWETATEPNPCAMVFSDGVWYDPADRLFKMWYMAGYDAGTAYATSADGLHWDKPALNVIGSTNLVQQGRRDSSTIWLDPSPASPGERFKMAYFAKDRLWLSTSADGIHWSKPVNGPATGDRSTFFYNPFRRRWVFSLRADAGGYGRIRRYWETSDFLRSTTGNADEPAGPAPPLWAGADSADPRRDDLKTQPELYNLDCVAYESLLLGLFSIWRGQPRDRPKPNEICLGFSRDGFHWHRPDRRAFIPVSERFGVWNWGNVQSAGGCCLVVGDKLYFYVSGRAGVPGTHSSGVCSTGLAFLRRDGFASLDAGEQEGAITTRPTRFAGRYLFVNADAHAGELTAELLDERGRVIKPFTRDNCIPVRADATRVRVAWHGAADLSALANRAVRFRFTLRNGQLFAFWVSPDLSGASGGYLAAGGPGLSTAVDTTGAAAANTKRPERPNVVVILADDLGYGDVGCYGATKVKTPNIDRLAREGRLFTDAHTASSVCTPSRYALLTGQYAWRHKPASGILPGNAPLSIPIGRMTLPRLFREAGYETAAVGKWHLGLGEGEPDFNKELRPGPLEIGFDYFFGYAATNDRTPCVYIENHRVVGADPNDPIRVSYRVPLRDDPLGREHPELLKLKLIPGQGHSDTIIYGISRIGYMSGGHRARWRDDDMADVLTGKAVDFMARARRPFFLYFAPHNIHVPRYPHARFRGTSQCGLRGDAIQELDASVGQVASALDRLHLADDTLLIVTSDNGGILEDAYQDGAGHDGSGHRCNGSLRGDKGGLFEGGHRVPFLARWKGHIEPGTSDQLICLVDLPATCAALLGRSAGPDAFPDSVDVLPALLGTAQRPARTSLVHHTGGGGFPGRLAIRSGPWKLIPAPPRSRIAGTKAGPLLFNLADDPHESRDLSANHPEKISELVNLLQTVRAAETAPRVR